MLKVKLSGITLYVHECCNDKAARYLKVEWCHYGDIKYLLFRLAGSVSRKIRRLQKLDDYYVPLKLNPNFLKHSI